MARESDPALVPIRSSIRNIGIIAHIDAGKTTTTERILYYTGSIHRMGDVDKGNTTTDFDPEEQERGITINSAAVSCRWKDTFINIIDTPGHVDFTAEVERSLRVLDGAIVIFSAVEGVEAQSETVWRQANKYNIPRIGYINKMDRIGAEFERVVQEMRDRLDAHPIPVQIPIGAGPEGTMGQFQGLIDLITEEALYFQTEDLGSTITVKQIPDDQQERFATWRGAMLDAIADIDEEFADAYMAHLEGEPLDPKTIRQALRKACLRGQVQPLLCGSSYKYVGVQHLLDSVTDYLPSPEDVPSVHGIHPKKGDEIVRKLSVDEPLAALVFKITASKHGDLCFVRVYSGKLEAGSRAFNPGKGKKEICSRLVRVQADHETQVDQAIAGDIIGVVGLKVSYTGDTLCDAQKPILLEKIEFPETVISMSVEPLSSADKGKLAATLDSLAREDPTFRYNVHEETGQTLISGMGELHLERIKTRMTRDYKVGVHVGKPRVSYRETIKGGVKGIEGSCIRQTTTGQDLFAKLTIDLEPETQPKGQAPVRIVRKIKHDVIPAEFLTSIEEELLEEARSGSGGWTGYPLVDLKITIADGKYDDQTSNEQAFRFAASDAFGKALEKAGAAVLEPVMRLEVATPEEHIGSVTADLMTRRAEILGTETRGKLTIVIARVPLEKMFGYSTAVRSLSQGRASYSMEFAEYAQAPDEILQKLGG